MSLLLNIVIALSELLAVVFSLSFAPEVGLFEYLFQGFLFFLFITLLLHFLGFDPELGDCEVVIAEEVVAVGVVVVGGDVGVLVFE